MPHFSGFESEIHSTPRIIHRLAHRFGLMAPSVKVYKGGSPNFLLLFIPFFSQDDPHKFSLAIEKFRIKLLALLSGYGHRNHVPPW